MRPIKSEREVAEALAQALLEIIAEAPKPEGSSEIATLERLIIERAKRLAGKKFPRTKRNGAVHV